MKLLDDLDTVIAKIHLRHRCLARSGMKYLALATDYDGTLASDGQVDDRTLEALRRWRSTGRRLLLITGRRLDDFLGVFPQIDLFDLAIVENGAVLYSPAAGTETDLGAPPPPNFVDQLRDLIAQHAATAGSAADSPALATGRVIVATWQPHDVTARALMREMGLEQWQIIMNKQAVMILPQGVDKVTGLQAALKQLEIPVEAVVGVGDAENDLTFLSMCGLSAAVDNALAEVKTAVDWVAQMPRGAGVAELIDYVLANDGPNSEASPGN